MAAGLPVVANPVGVHAEIIQHGETGFLAETPAAWLTAMDTLAADPCSDKRWAAPWPATARSPDGVATGANAWLAVFAQGEQRQSRRFRFLPVGFDEVLPCRSWSS